MGMMKCDSEEEKGQSTWSGMRVLDIKIKSFTW